MHLQLQTDANSRTAYFGISDFESDIEDGKTGIAFHRDVNLGSDRCYRTEDGNVVTAVSESGYNEEGAYETIGDLASNEDVRVVVAETDRYPWVANAARRLKQEDDIADKFKFIEKETENQ